MPVSAFARCTAFLLGVGAAAVGPGRALAADYYIYENAKGRLVISNKAPPPGSRIIKKHDLPEPAEGQKHRAGTEEKTQQSDEPPLRPK